MLLQAPLSLYLALVLIFAALLVVGVVAIVPNINIKKLLGAFRRGVKEHELIHEVVENYMRYRALRQQRARSK